MGGEKEYDSDERREEVDRPDPEESACGVGRDLAAAPTAKAGPMNAVPAQDDESEHGRMRLATRLEESREPFEDRRPDNAALIRAI